MCFLQPPLQFTSSSTHLLCIHQIVNNNMIHHLLSICHVPNTVLSTLYTIINLDPTITLQDKHLWSHFLQ